jgi:hypothetical protein
MPLAMKHERLLDGDGAVTAKVENVTIRFCKKTKKGTGMIVLVQSLWIILFFIAMDEELCPVITNL